MPHRSIRRAVALVEAVAAVTASGLMCFAPPYKLEWASFTTERSQTLTCLRSLVATQQALHPLGCTIPS